MLKKLNFWSKSYPNPTPFLGQYDSNHVQCGYVLVQYGHVLSLHLLKAKARPKRGQGKVKVRSKLPKNNLNRNYNLMGFDTIEINLV